jgi:hypothetical protein
VGRIHTGAGAAAEDRGFSSTEERAMAFGVRRSASGGGEGPLVCLGGGKGSSCVLSMSLTLANFTLPLKYRLFLLTPLNFKFSYFAPIASFKR